MEKIKVILSGGGTGGHIYPAVAVAEALRRRLAENVEILFVGAQGKMEAEKIPALGYRIECLPVVGLQRKLSLSNLMLPFKVRRSIGRAKDIVRSLDADVVAGFGGYASGPVLWAAQRLGLPTLIQEQNSYAGITNKILGRRADKICVAYDGMERFFPAEKIVFTGNPLRADFSDMEAKRSQALEYFGFDGTMPVLLVVGGSLGTRTLNEMMKQSLDTVVDGRLMNVIWQTGKLYEREIDQFLSGRDTTGIWRGAFIERMDLAYSAADVVVSRSGANTVSELCLVGKPTIFVPSPNVTDDHQTKNAQALVEKGAAMMVPDHDAPHVVVPTVERLLADKRGMENLSGNMLELAMPDAAENIADMIITLAEQQKERRR